MTTLSLVTLAAASTVTQSSNAANNPASASSAAAQEAITPSPSTIVTIPSADYFESLETYTADGTLASAAPTVTWATNSSDSVTTRMMGDYMSQSFTGQFYGLGSEVLDRFKTTGSDFTQSVNVSSTSASGLTLPSTQGPQADVKLTVETASGVKVEIDLDSETGENSQLSVSVHSSGNLSVAERNAIAKMADGFQDAINGFSTQPPSVNLSGLTQYDPSVLSSVNLQVNVTGDGSNDLSASYSTSSATRTLSLSGATGTMKVSVNTSDSALWGSDAQRSQAIASYLTQFDNASAEGHGNAEMMSMFKDAFTQMNSNYGTPSQQLPGTTYAPWLAQSDHAMLTGLADFNASITDTPASSNPLLPDQTDNFSYQVSQTTSTDGNQEDGQISQQQHSHLSASYHQDLNGTGTPVLGKSLSSQNYNYVQISDDETSAANISTQDGKLIDASVSQSSSQSLEQSKYALGKLISDVTTPSNSSRSRDLLAPLKPLFANNQAEQNSEGWQQALGNIHGMVLLNSSAQ
ncbi:MAG: hypothetical protein WCA85_14390 [Paraburkholderia sp.]